jgi:hypothetical protein
VGKLQRYAEARDRGMRRLVAFFHGDGWLYGDGWPGTGVPREQKTDHERREEARATRAVDELERNGTAQRVLAAQKVIASYFVQHALQRRFRKDSHHRTKEMREAILAMLAERGLALEGVDVEVRNDPALGKIHFRAIPSRPAMAAAYAATR